MEKGGRAAVLALKLLEGEDAGHLRLPADLVVRGSTAAPRDLLAPSYGFHETAPCSN